MGYFDEKPATLRMSGRSRMRFSSLCLETMSMAWPISRVARFWTRQGATKKRHQWAKELLEEAISGVFDWIPLISRLNPGRHA